MGVIEVVGAVMSYTVFFGLFILPLCGIGIAGSIEIAFAIGDF